MSRRAYVFGSNGPPWSSKLRFALNDVQMMANSLRKHGDFNVVSPSAGSSPFQVIEELAGICGACEFGDLLLVYFSGHGELVNGELYLLWDNTTQRIFDSALSCKSVLDLLKHSQASHKLLILDCCHAGAAAGFKGAQLPFIDAGSCQLILCASSRLESAREQEALKCSFLAYYLSATLSDDKRPIVYLSDVLSVLQRSADLHNDANPQERVPKPYLFGELKSSFLLKQAGLIDGEDSLGTFADGLPFKDSEDCFDRCFLRQKAVMDRSQLRRAIRHLADEHGVATVLTVDGPPGAGKTFSVRFIQSVAETLGTFRVIGIDLRDMPATLLGPDDLVRSIALQMNRAIDTIPSQQSPAARWVRELADWVAGQASDTGKRWWIVIDGFENRQIPDETIEFIHRLAADITTHVSSLRLVLLSYGGQLPARTDEFVMNETLQPLSDIHIREFFERLARFNEVEMSVDALEELTSNIIDRMPHRDLGDIKAVSTVVTEVAKRVFPRGA